MDEQQQADLKNRFMHHTPKAGQTEQYEAVRAKCLDLAEFIASNTPSGREQSLAFTNLEQVMFWANAAIARN